MRLGIGQIAFLIAAHGYAQQSAVPLPPVIVPAPRDVEAPGDSPSQRDPTGSVTTLDASEFRGEAKDAAELLAPAPGVLVQGTGGFGQSKALSIRGASSNGVLVLLDGIPLNGAGATVDISRIPEGIIERVEVLRGGAGARYGSGGLGGVVNFITRSHSQPTFSAEAVAGSFRTGVGQLGASLSQGRTDFLAIAHGNLTRGDFSYRYNPAPELPDSTDVERTRQNNQSSQGGALLKVLHSLSNTATLQALLDYYAESRGLAGPVQNPTPDTHQKSQRLLSQIRFNQLLGARLDLSARVSARGEWQNFGGSFFGPQLRQLEKNLFGEITSSLLWETHTLSAALSASGDWLTVIGSRNPSWLHAAGMLWDEWAPGSGNLLIVPSLRYQKDGPFGAWSPKLGASWRFSRGWEIRSNVGQAQRAPSFLELYVYQGTLVPNPTLKPERALYVDGAVSKRTSSFQLTVGGFFSAYENLISYEYYPPLLARPYNFASAQAYGLEVEGHWRPNAFLKFNYSYTLLFSRNLRDDPQYYLKELPYRPRHKAYARATLGSQILFSTIEALFQSKQYTNRTQSLSLPSRLYLNARLSYAFTRQPEIVASLEVKNILDAQSQDYSGYPLPGRAFFVTLSGEWGQKSSTPHHNERKGNET